ncbi:MAG TPA: hypothetical protein VFD16_02730 [Candidatus Saccharimonadales bacterium]|nr:hypothetical protein [Candidatus Saccharimonadales bacterium]
MDKKTFGNALFTGGIEGVIISLLHNVGKVAEEKGGKYLEAKLFGLGTNDEALFMGALEHAVKRGWMTEAKLLEICRIVDGYEDSQATKIRMTFAKEQVDVTYEAPKMHGGKVVIDETTGKPVMEKITEKANVKGAELLALLARFDEAGIKQILKTSGASVSFEDNLKKKVAAAASKISTTIGNSQIKQEGDTFFTKKTWLEKLADDLEAKHV